MSIRSVGVAEGGEGRSVGVAGGEREERRIKHASAGTALPDGVHVGHVYTWAV